MQAKRTKHKVREPNITVHNQAKHKHNRKLLFIEIVLRTYFRKWTFTHWITSAIPYCLHHTVLYCNTQQTIPKCCDDFPNTSPATDAGQIYPVVMICIHSDIW